MAKQPKKLDQLIEIVETAFSEGLPFAYVDTAGYSIATIRALKERGYRIERRVLGGAYHVYPKPVPPAVEKTYLIPWTESEIVVIREAIRNFPRNTEFSLTYEPELFSIDKKTTAQLADIVEEAHGLKKT